MHKILILGRLLIFSWFAAKTFVSEEKGRPEVESYALRHRAGNSTVIGAKLTRRRFLSERLQNMNCRLFQAQLSFGSNRTKSSLSVLFWILIHFYSSCLSTRYVCLYRLTLQIIYGIIAMDIYLWNKLPLTATLMELRFDQLNGFDLDFFAKINASVLVIGERIWNSSCYSNFYVL